MMSRKSSKVSARLDLRWIIRWQLLQTHRKVSSRIGLDPFGWGCTKLLHVMNLRKIASPFSVDLFKLKPTNLARIAMNSQRSKPVVEGSARGLFETNALVLPSRPRCTVSSSSGPQLGL